MKKPRLETGPARISFDQNRPNDPWTIGRPVWQKAGTGYTLHHTDLIARFPTYLEAAAYLRPTSR